MGDPTPPEPARGVRKLLLRNQRDSPLIVVLEPWAGEYEIAPRETLEIVEEAEESAESLEIQVEAEHIVFWARSNSILRAFRDGVELP
jgi:hypothetical protein